MVIIPSRNAGLGEDTAGLHPAPEILLHCCKTRYRFRFGDTRRIPDAVEPVAHQVRALPAVGEFLIVGTTVIDRTTVNADVCSPERGALRLRAAGTFFFVVLAVAAGVPADSLDLLRCHNQVLFFTMDKGEGMSPAKVTGYAHSAGNSRKPVHTAISVHRTKRSA
jgi:hypothetical protein